MRWWAGILKTTNQTIEKHAERTAVEAHVEVKCSNLLILRVFLSEPCGDQRRRAGGFQRDDVLHLHRQGSQPGQDGWWLAGSSWQGNIPIHVSNSTTTALIYFGTLRLCYLKDIFRIHQLELFDHWSDGIHVVSTTDSTMRLHRC